MSELHTRERQKVGDSLILTGRVTVNAASVAALQLLSSATWSGATAVLNVYDRKTRDLVIDGETVTLDLTPLAGNPAALPRYSFTGAMPAVGFYDYEIVITFSDGKHITAPNAGSEHELEVLAR